MKERILQLKSFYQNKRKLLSVLLCVFIFTSCIKEFKRPNVILIMADDMGYECLGSYGSKSYNTPNLDLLAHNGIRFSKCISQPICTPSRVKLMTGKYNYRNYDYFGNLNTSEYTFGNLMKSSGYSTCIAGKWQLNGLYDKDSILTWNDNTKPNQFGFDEYCLWQLTKDRALGERYANPLIEQNGEILTRNKEVYGPDIFSEYILEFIERKKEQPFFVYYPMVLVHDPFVPTPDSKDWKDETIRYKNDTTYFKDMVAYTDKIVGRIVAKLKELEIDDNTLVIFTGDNGTHTSIHTNTDNGIVQGGKGFTTDAGTLVPLIAHWPKMIKEGFSYDELIEFSDFFPTLADIAGVDVKSDGKSFFPLLTNSNYEPRNTAFVHYDHRWANKPDKRRNRFVRTTDYKLYQDGGFYNLSSDIKEEVPLNTEDCTRDELVIKDMLARELQKHPGWKK